jgi:uncharacterized membrane protein
VPEPGALSRWALPLMGIVAIGGAVLWLRGRPHSRPYPSKRRADMPTLAGGRGSHVERTITVQRPPGEVYRTWRDLERLPRLLTSSLVSVTHSGPRRTRWVVTGPGGTQLAWEAELTADEPGRLLGWRSVGDSDVDIGGSVRFEPAPGGRGTEIKVILTYAPPGGKLGAAAAALIGQGGDRQVREALRRFKQLLEAGEIATAERLRGGEPEEATAPSVARGA